MSEAAWAAGFYDGEGGAYYVAPTRMQLEVAQIHLGQLERFRAAVAGLGQINGYNNPSRVRTGRSPAWRWKASGVLNCQKVLHILWPWLGEPKREQWLDAMERYLDYLERPGATGKPGAPKRKGVPA